MFINLCHLLKLTDDQPHGSHHKSITNDYKLLIIFVEKINCLLNKPQILK